MSKHLFFKIILALVFASLFAGCMKSAQPDAPVAEAQDAATTYRDNILLEGANFTAANDKLVALLGDYQKDPEIIGRPDWQAALQGELDELANTAKRMYVTNPPAQFTEANEMMREAAAALSNASKKCQQWIESGEADQTELDRIIQSYWSGFLYYTKAVTMVVSAE